MNVAKVKAREFIKRYEIRSLSYLYLNSILRDMGFAVVSHSHYENSPNTEALLESIRMKDYSMLVKSFNYTDDSKKIVFILEKLCEEDKILMLLHEIGHIYCDKEIADDNIVDTDIQKEKTADEFAKHVLKRVKNKVNPIITVCLILSVCATLYLISKTNPGTNPATTAPPSQTYKVVHTENPTPQTPQHPELQNGDMLVYITPGGNKFHTADCRYVKNKSNINELPRNTTVDLGYEPCSVCNP